MSSTASAGVHSATQRLRALQELQRQGVSGLDEAVAQLEAEVREHRQGIGAQVWARQGGRLRGRTPAAQRQQGAAQQRRCSLRCVAAGAVGAASLLLLLRTGTQAIAAGADDPPLPAGRSSWYRAAAEDAASAPREAPSLSAAGDPPVAAAGAAAAAAAAAAAGAAACNPDRGPLGNATTSEEVCSVARWHARAQRSTASGFTLAVLAHKGRRATLARTLESWADAALLSHPLLREVVVHRGQCADCSEAATLAGTLLGRAAPRVAVRVICEPRNRPLAQAITALAAAARTRLLLLLDAARPALRGATESQAEIRERVAAAVDAAAAAAERQLTPLVFVHRAALSHRDDAQYARWVLAQRAGQQPALPAELSRPAHDGSPEMARCRRWCVDFALTNPADDARPLVPTLQRSPEWKRDLAVLCRRLGTATLAEAANATVTEGSVKCGPTRDGFQPADDCGCLWFVCREWAYWRDPDPEGAQRQHVPLCSATWLRQTGAAPDWWRRSALAVMDWNPAMGSSPATVLCTHARSAQWSAAPAMFRTEWWVGRVASSLCADSRSRAASGMGHLPGRQRWSQYAAALRKYISQNVLQGPAAAPVCQGDTVVDWLVDPEDPSVGDMDVEVPSREDVFDFAAKGAASQAEPGVDAAARLAAASAAQFPRGTQVEFVGSVRALQGKRGTVTGTQEDRLVVFFPVLGASRAVLPINLRPARQPTRIRLGCSTADLSLPQGAGLLGVGCGAEGVVARQGSCAVSLRYHQCTAVGCSPSGQWNTTAAACVRTHCAVNELRLAAGAALGGSCAHAADRGVQGGVVCPLVSALATCSSVRCGAGGVWNATVPQCERCADFDDSNFPGANMPPDNWKADSACDCRQLCYGLGALAWSWVSPAHYQGPRGHGRRCHCKDLIPSPITVQGVYSGRTGKRDKNMPETPQPMPEPPSGTADAAVAAEEAARAAALRPEAKPDPKLAGQCGKGLSGDKPPWGDEVEQMQRAVERLQLRSAAAIRGCAAAMRRARAAWKRALPWAAQVSFAAIDPGSSSARAPVCYEMPPNVGRIPARQMAVWRGAVDPDLQPGVRRLVIAVGSMFGQRVGGDWIPGPLAEFVCGYPYGYLFDPVAFDPDRGSGDDVEYPGGAVALVPARAGTRSEDSDPPTRDLALWLSEHAAPRDFVVLVLDVPWGGEKDLIAHLAATGALSRVDEVLLACGDRAKPSRSEDCAAVRTGLLEYHIPVHDWPPPDAD